MNNLDYTLNKIAGVAAKFGDPAGYVRVSFVGSGTLSSYIIAYAAGVTGGIGAAYFAGYLKDQITSILSANGYPAIAGTVRAGAVGTSISYSFDIYIRCNDNLGVIRDHILDLFINGGLTEAGSNEIRTVGQQATRAVCASTGGNAGGGGNGGGGGNAGGGGNPFVAPVPPAPKSTGNFFIGTDGKLTSTGIGVLVVSGIAVLTLVARR